MKKQMIEKQISRLLLVPTIDYVSVCVVCIETGYFVPSQFNASFLKLWIFVGYTFVCVGVCSVPSSIYLLTTALYSRSYNKHLINECFLCTPCTQKRHRNQNEWMDKSKIIKFECNHRVNLDNYWFSRLFFFHFHFYTRWIEWTV